MNKKTSVCDLGRASKEVVDATIMDVKVRRAARLAAFGTIGYDAYVAWVLNRGGM